MKNEVVKIEKLIRKWIILTLFTISLGSYLANQKSVNAKQLYSYKISTNFTIKKSDIDADDEDTIIKKNISAKSFSNISNYIYTGSQITPEIVIKDGDKTLIKDEDYTLSYINNTNVGTAYVIVTGKGNYYGEKTISFEIKKATYQVKATAYNKKYDGKAHSITISNVKSGSTIKYRTNTKNVWSTKKPTRTKVGTTTVYYQITNPNYNTITGSKKITITKAKQSISAKAYKGAYNAKAHTITLNNVLKGSTIKYRTSTKASWSTKKPSRTNVGTTTVYYRITNPNCTNVVTGSKKITITKGKQSISAKAYSGTYDGKAHSITLSNAFKDSTLQYRTSTKSAWSTKKPSRTNVGTTTVYYRITNPNCNTVTGSKKITINKKSLSKLTISQIPSTKVYTGKAIKPAVTIKDGNKTLKNGIDYSVTYAKNINCGSASIKITGMGNYSGSISKTFSIVPSKPTAIKLTSKEESIKVSYSKVTGASGYEIAYSTNKSSGFKTIATVDASITISKLDIDKTYYVKVRSYKVVDGKHYYGSYSAVSSVKTMETASDNPGILIELDVPYINQYEADAPMGCEAASLLEALHAKGYAKSYNLKNFLKEMPLAADGNPNHGFGSTPYKIVLNTYQSIYPAPLAKWGSKYGDVVNISGASKNKLVEELKNENPIVIYTVYNFAYPVYGTYKFGKAIDNAHIMTLIGYNSEANLYKVADPAGGIYWVNGSDFVRCYNYTHYAVVVR